MKPRRIEEEPTQEEVTKTLDPTVVDEKDIIGDIEELEEERLTQIKGIGSFAKKSMITLGLLFSIILVGTLYDVTQSVGSMMQNAPFIGVVYLGLIFSFIGLVGYGIFKQYRSYVSLKRIDSLQERGLKLIKKPTKDVINYANEIISVYEQHPDKGIRRKAETLRGEIQTLMHDEVIDRIDEVLLKPLDKKAQKAIIKYSNQTAISTAISPVAFIDALLILSRSYAMVNDIAKIYGYRPTFVGELVLIKRVFINLAFASVTDILTNHSHDILGTTILSKLSYHGAQGIANGILTARVGLGTIKSCRPILYKDKNSGFLKSLSKTITDTIFKKR